jgi:hypothetical protein
MKQYISPQGCYIGTFIGILFFAFLFLFFLIRLSEGRNYIGLIPSSAPCEMPKQLFGDPFFYFFCVYQLFSISITYSISGYFNYNYIQCHSFFIALFRYICFFHSAKVERLGYQAPKVSAMKYSLHTLQTIMSMRIKGANCENIGVAD